MYVQVISIKINGKLIVSFLPFVPRLLLYLDPLPRQRMVSVVDPLGTPHEQPLFLTSPDPRYPRSSSYDPRHPIKEEDSAYPNEIQDPDTRYINGGDGNNPCYRDDGNEPRYRDDRYHDDDDDPNRREERDGQLCLSNGSENLHGSSERVQISNYNTPDPIPSPVPLDHGEVPPYATPPPINHIDVVKRLSDVGQEEAEPVSLESAHGNDARGRSNSFTSNRKDSSHSRCKIDSVVRSVPPLGLGLQHCTLEESSSLYYTPHVTSKSCDQYVM